MSEARVWTRGDLDKLRAPVPDNEIGKLPRITCKDCREAGSKVCSKHAKSKCQVCDNYITGAHLHLDYFGHAETTDRLLSVDPEWSWEPIGWGDDGMPLTAKQGPNLVMWGRLTVCGITRLGVGTAGASKEDAHKELIGDFLRNAAMRFGVALDLWRKSERAEHDDEPGPVMADHKTHEALRLALAPLPSAVKAQFKKWRTDNGLPAFAEDDTLTIGQVSAAHDEIGRLQREAAKTAENAGTNGGTASGVVSDGGGDDPTDTESRETSKDSSTQAGTGTPAADPGAVERAEADTSAAPALLDAFPGAIEEPADVPVAVARAQARAATRSGRR